MIGTLVSSVLIVTSVRSCAYSKCSDIGKYKTCAKCQQKILNSMVVAPPQSFRFFRQKTWFLENNRALSKLLYEILHDLINKISP